MIYESIYNFYDNFKHESMERSCNFYSCIPGFKLVYGGSHSDSFTTYKIGSGDQKIIPRCI